MAWATCARYRRPCRPPPGHVAGQVIVTSRPEEVRAAQRIVLPGQGAMPDCMRELRESGLRESVLEAAATKPLFGVCVGMQMLLDHSAEGDTPGLGLIPGEVLKFDLAGRTQADGSRYKVPQMGWNQCARCPRRCGAPGVGKECPTATATSISCTAFMPARSMRATVQARQTTAVLSPPPLRAIIFLRRNSTRKKARSMAWQLYRNFLHWNP
jgi:glutamine amidotransferase